MDKKKKILIAFGSLAALYGLALLIFWVVVKIKENNGKGAPPAQGGEAEEQSVESSIKWSNFPLKWGSGSSRNLNQQQVQGYVRGIQAICNNWVGSNLAKDGIWGDKTEAAIQQLATVNYVVLKPGEEEFRTTVDAPFARCIAQVQNPVSKQSKKQIFVSRYNEMVEWHNKYCKKYQRIQ